MNKLAIITGTRAEYGLLKPLISKLKNCNEFDVKVIATGTHLSPEFGYTYKEIEKDNIHIDEKVEILMSSDSSIGVSKSLGLAIISFSEVFDRMKPDAVIVLGDRYEIYGVTTAASISKIPVIHLHGGETTEGAFDEAFRHCITKMSYLHFTSTEEYRKRVIQLGENPSRVFNVGAIGIENIVSIDLLSKAELENSIEFILDKPFGIVTFHPVTLESGTAEKQFRELLNALDKVQDMKFIITKANADSDGRIINKMIDDYTEKNKERVISFTSMGQLRYLSAIEHCSVVIGNSSSGILEVPSFKKPTVNIGDRQKGRLQAPSIINCEPIENKILESIEKARSKEFVSSLKNIINPYGDGNTSNKIIEEIKNFFNKSLDLKKPFYDIY